MANYIKRPEPGRFTTKETIVERIIEKEKEPEQQPEQLDVNMLANAIAQAINIKLPQTVQGITVVDTGKTDTFDNSKTMARLATQMLVQRSDSESNFEDLGNIEKTKKNQKDTDITIDLLSKLDN